MGKTACVMGEECSKPIVRDPAPEDGLGTVTEDPPDSHGVIAAMGAPAEPDRLETRFPSTRDRQRRWERIPCARDGRPKTTEDCLAAWGDNLLLPLGCRRRPPWHERIRAEDGTGQPGGECTRGMLQALARRPPRANQLAKETSECCVS